MGLEAKVNLSEIGRRVEQTAFYFFNSNFLDSVSTTRQQANAGLCKMIRLLRLSA